MADVAAAERELNALLAAGRVVEAFERFYADDIEMQENLNPPMVGKAANYEREKAFWGPPTKVHRIELHGGAVSGDVSYSEWTFDLTLANGFHLVLTEVTARRWRDGKVVHERFYYDPKAFGG